MRLSKFFLKTHKSISNDIEQRSHQILIKGGYIAESVAGRFYYLPLGMIVRDNIVRIIEKKMNSLGALKMMTPVLHPKTLWEETKRDESVGFELMTIVDRNENSFVLGGTAEEMFVDLVRRYNISYKDLPFCLYQFSQKFRDEFRARGGLLRLREFLMKDAYSFHTGRDEFEDYYMAMTKAYQEIFDELGLTTSVVQSDNGYIGGEYCHELIVESEVGESKYFVAGDYAAHEDIASFDRLNTEVKEIELPLEKVKAARGKTIQDGVKLHKKEADKHLKNVCYIANCNIAVIAVIRGDYDVNEVKLQHLLGASTLELMNDYQISDYLGSVTGFVGPVGIKKVGKDIESLKIVADISSIAIVNAVSGANELAFDYVNINYDRDWNADIVGDIALAKEGYAISGETLVEKKGIEVGNVFQLGEHYSSKMHAKYTDKHGNKLNYYMGCYGIGIDRTLAAIVEIHSKQGQLLWPVTVAPFLVEIIILSNKEDKLKIAEDLEEVLNNNKISNVVDDRDIRAGEKFADSELIGAPIKIVISDKTDINNIEVKNMLDSNIVQFEEVVLICKNLSE